MKKTCNSKRNKDLQIPTDYIISKFFEFGVSAQENSYNQTYQCGCPICREGKSNGRKKRCFYIPSNNNIYCHNCGWSSTPLRWIMTVSGMSYDEVAEEISEGEFDMIDAMKLEEVTTVQETPTLPVDCINLYNSTELSYYKDSSIVNRVVNYAKQRRLFTAINRPSALYLSLKDTRHKNRLILPFKNTGGNIVFYQSRKVFDSDESLSYLSKTNADRSVFNIDKITSEDEHIYIFEGPIDACFVRNGVAISGITERGEPLNALQTQQLREFAMFKKIWVLDSQWVDSASYEKSLYLLERGESVFLWSKKLGIKYKDFNQICVEQNLDEVPAKIILNNVVSGAEGILKLKLIPPP